MARGAGRVAGAAGLAFLPVAFLGVLFTWPVVAIIRLGFADGGVAAVLAESTTWRLAGFTVAQAAAATALAVLAGMPLAWHLTQAHHAGVITLMSFRCLKRGQLGQSGTAGPGSA
ncbi:hypothetical protein [Saccharomonospora saliphila]|uniref:hypothetical protein n=1 Tax=Saccharomonospora saliphila TaxID=369829 RepID=UPI000376084B